MSTTHRFTLRDDLFSRQKIEIELPRFLLRVFEKEIEKANVDALEEDRINLNHYLEYHLAEFVSLTDVVELEREAPGISAAVWRWLEESNS